MKRLLIAAALGMLAASVAHAQTKVANFALGKFGTDKYEQLSFWVKDGKRGAIYYAYSQGPKTVKLKYVGKILTNTKPGFTIQFSNGHVLSIVPGDSILQVFDAANKIPEIYAWEYVGPVNGIGTFCEQCAEDEKEAMQIIRNYYLK